MRCNDCQYPLWNLRARNCPECGKQFAPSGYHFVPNSVRFCCPHCEQEYYGTGERGQLVPPAFECVTCRNPITMDEMVLRPVRGEEDKTYAVIEPLPWLQRHKAGWIRCWWKTVWRGMIAPNLLMRGLPAEARVGEAWLFAFITLFATLICGAGLPLGVVAIFDMASGGGDALEIMFAAAAVPLGTLALTLLYIVVWGLTTHWTLLLTGGCERTLSGTFQTICYSVGPNIFIAVPCLGMYCLGYVSSIWWIVSAILMLMTLQNVHGGRAALAALVLPIISVIAFGVLYVGVIFGGLFMGGFGANAFVTQQQIAMTQVEVQSMVGGLRSYASIHSNWPIHASQLIDDQTILSSSFFSSSTLTYLDTTPLADGTLEDFEYANVRERKEMIDAAVASQPKDIIAHRLGDYVFTYHGIDPNEPDARLWVFVLIEDPDMNPPEFAVDPVFVGSVDGSVSPIDRAGFDLAVVLQNTVRAEHSLPPLPNDLLDVTHDKPATGP